ncbi:hypothetical protein BG004_005757 [Podila humilis]|nr:hypothetical protein BG004_005757 [Podila humilis]
MEELQRTLAQLRHQQDEQHPSQQSEDANAEQTIEETEEEHRQHDSDISQGEETSQEQHASSSTAEVEPTVESVTDSATQLLLRAQDILMLKQHELTNGGPVSVHALQPHTDQVPTLDSLEMIEAPTSEASNTAIGESSTSSQAQVPASEDSEEPSSLDQESPSSSGPMQDEQPRFDKHPITIKVPEYGWEAWLEKEKIYCKWNQVRYRVRDKPAYGRGPTPSEWSREFQCEHAGQYRDRKNPNIDASKKRKRGESIKCGCTAAIKMKKHFQDDEVSIEYFWRHVGHVPENLVDTKSQRLPTDLREWIKRRVSDGHDWKSIKGMLLNGSPALDELSPSSKQNAKQWLQTSYSQCANYMRVLEKHNSSTTSSQSTENARGGRSVVQFSDKDEDMHLAKRVSSSAKGKGKSVAYYGKQRAVDKASGTWQLANLTAGTVAEAGSLADELRRRLENHDGSTLAIHTLSAVSAASASSDQGHGLTLPAANSSDALLAQVISDLQRSAQGTAASNETTVKVAADLILASSEAGPSARIAVDQGQQQARTELLATLRSIADLYKQMETSEQCISQDDTKQITDSFAVATRLLKEALERSSGTGDKSVPEGSGSTSSG